MANKIDLIINGQDKASGVIGRVSGSIQKLSGHAARGAQQLTAITAAGAGLAAAGLAGVFRKASSAGQQLEKSMVSLEVISETFGVSQEKAKQQAKSLGEELRIGPTAAAESLQNLLKSGLNIDQASELMSRFANEALTGKAAGVSLSEAVQNLASGYQMEMSALMDRSGISENISSLMQKEADARGVTLSQLDEAARAQLKYDAFIKLTNQTLGSAEKFQGTYTDNLAIMNTRMQGMFQTIGSKLNPVLNKLLISFMKSDVIGKFTSFLTGLIDKALALKEVLVNGNFNKAVAEAFNVNEDSKFITFLFNARDAALKVINFLQENRVSVIDFFKAFGVGTAVVVAITAAVAVLTSPLTLIVGLIAAVAAAFTAFQKFKPQIVGFFDAAKQKISEFLNQGGMIGFFVDMFEDAMNKLVTAFQNLLPTLEPLWNSIKNLFTSLMPVFKVVGAVIAGVLAAVVYATIQVATGFLAVLKPAIQVLTFAFNFLAGVIDVVVAVIMWLVTKSGPALAGFGQAVSNVFKTIGDFIGRVWNGIVTGIQVAFQLIKNVVSTAAQPFIIAFNFIKNIVVSTFNLIKFIVLQALNNIGLFVLQTVNKIKIFFTPLANFLRPIFTKIYTIAKGVFDQVMKVVSFVIKNVVSGFNILKGAVVGVLVSIASFAIGKINQIKSGFNIMGTFISSIFSNVRSRASSIFNSIKDTIVDKINVIKDTFSKIGDGIGGVFNNVKSLFKEGFNGLIGVINSGIGKVNGLIDKANEAPGVSFPTLPTIPSFATGGQFMVGGRGGTDNNFVGFMASRGERVTVETKGQQQKNDRKESGGTININNTFNGTGLTVDAVSDRLAFQLVNLQ